MNPENQSGEPVSTPAKTQAINTDCRTAGEEEINWSDWSTWLLADEVNWPDQELRCMNRGGRRVALLLLVSAGRSTGGTTGRSRGRLEPVADDEGDAYGKDGPWVLDRSGGRRPAGADAGAAAEGWSLADGNSDGGRGRSERQVFFKLGVVSYFFSFSSGRRIAPMTNKSVQRE
ncbi:hypothetical protein VPH35_090895 [Triticum aestivum]